MPRLTLADIPVEVLVDNLSPFLHPQDLLHLASTDKFFFRVLSDNTLWKRRLESDFNFSGERTARTDGWKFIYRGLSKPRVFVWGERANGRLGLSRFPSSSIHGVPFPVELRIPGVRVVDLVAGGMSFHALDAEGCIHVWGTLDGTTSALNNDGFSQAAKRTDTPLRLQLPLPIRRISCGRLHSSCIDRNDDIWTFVNWGRPFRLSSQLLRDPNLAPMQIECGWGFSSILTKSGDVFVWWPMSGRMNERITAKDNELDLSNTNMARATPDGVIPCVTWALEMDPIRLPSLPPLPEFPDRAVSGNQIVQLVKIAALQDRIVGLTNTGHVLKFDSLDGEAAAPSGRWEYLPQFSEVQKVQKHPAFIPSSHDQVEAPSAPKSMQITHISANFQHFVAYSTGESSIVLIGEADTNPNSLPKILPALQNKSIISVALGDYHNAALTSSGKLLTWGAFSAGALGLGDPVKLTPGSAGAFSTEQQRVEVAEGHRRREPPATEIPAQVRFDHGGKKPKERFCFAVAAAGWHTGALVIDLEPDDDGDDEYAYSEAKPVTSQQHSRSQWETPPIIPNPFRIGFAGRGRGVGPHFTGQGGSSGQGT